jgi:hypothetical protein
VDSGDIAEHELHAQLTATAHAIGLTATETEATIRSAWRASQAKVGAAIIPERDETPAAYVMGGPVAEGEMAAPAPAYSDFAALLAGGLPDPPSPTFLARTDGVAFFYEAKRNDVYGDPEAFKTGIVQAAAAEHLRDGNGGVLFVDLDNNGEVETAQRMLMLGAPRQAVIDQNRFRHIEPASAVDMLGIVADCVGWATLVIIDCVGELIPLFGGKSDSADDYARIMRQVSTPLEHGGACVILIDHQAKGHDSRQYGAGGTMAKRRAVSGVSINVVCKRPFAPGKGGASELWINKDRPGGLRRHCPPPHNGSRRQFAGTFELDPPDPATGLTAWRVTADRVEPAFTLDPFVERHCDAAVEMGPGATFGASDLARLANRLPSDVPVTDTQRITASRAAESLTKAGRFEHVGVKPNRWKVADPDD